MRVLHLVASVDRAQGGVADAVLRLVETCRLQELTSGDEIVCLDEAAKGPAPDVGVPVHQLGTTARPGPVGRFLDHYRYSRLLRPWLTQNVSRFDVVVTHGLWNYSSVAASRVLPGGRVPYFTFAHGMLDPWFRRAYPKKHLLKQGFWLLAEGRLASHAKAVLFTCDEERRQARGVFRGWRYEERIAPLGASPPPPPDAGAARRFRDSVPALDERSYVLFLGRLHPKKGCDLLIQAFCERMADLPYDLVFAGPDSDDWRRRLEAQATASGGSGRIHWTGPLYEDLKWAAFRGAHAFILPSHQENFGIAVAEAMACGVPVAVSDKVNIWREIVEAGAGVVASDDLCGTRTLLDWAAELEGRRREGAAQAAQALYRENYDLASSARRFIDLLKTESVG